jgi:hypothetical protein
LPARHASSEGDVVLPADMGFSIRRRYTPAEDEPYMAEAIRDGLRLEAIAAGSAAANAYTPTTQASASA